MEQMRRDYDFGAKHEAELRRIVKGQFKDRNRKDRQTYVANLKVLKTAEKIISEELPKSEKRLHEFIERLSFSHAHNDVVHNSERLERFYKEAVQRQKVLIDGLRREQDKISTKLNHATPPKGNQMNYMLDYSIYWLAQNIKAKTDKHKYNWELVADLISEYLPVEVDANQALKAHKRFDRLLHDPDAFMKVSTANWINCNSTGRQYHVKSKQRLAAEA
jgi:hypothetical protein